MKLEGELLLEEGSVSAKNKWSDGNEGSNHTLFIALEKEMKDMEVDFELLFDKMLGEDIVAYEDKVLLLKNLGYLLESGTEGVHSEEALFPDDLKQILVSIWNDKVSNQTIIENAFDQVFHIIQPVDI